MLKEPEVLNLILGLLTALILLATLGMPAQRFQRPFFWALAALVASYLCTNLEVWLWPQLMNGLEHLFFALAGVLFLVGAIYLRRHEQAGGD